MMFPKPPLTVDPGDWTGMELYAATVLLEAGGEPDPGKLGVAWVIRNRMTRTRGDVHAVVLGPDRRAAGDGQPWEAFSCFNDDAVGLRQAHLRAPDPAVWERCWWAASAAYWQLLPDPTQGATFYLNVPLTRQIRRRHGSATDLPSWYDPARVTAEIGKHTFLRG